MRQALVIGATGFLGRYTVENLVEHGYEVVSLGRRTPTFQFSDPEAVDHVAMDRTDAATLTDVARRRDPDIVIDCAAFRPADLRIAFGVFDDVDAYVCVSSSAAYSAHDIPIRENQTPIHDCTSEEANDSLPASYGPRKAECDRLVEAVAERGLNTISVRPTAVYGPETPPGIDGSPANGDVSWAGGLPVNHALHDYWIDRIDQYDRIVVPGDGTALWHRAYGESVADAFRVVAERGEPGQGYNVGDCRVCTLDDIIDLIADALGTSIERVYASHRELAQVGLEPADFILYQHPLSGSPLILDTSNVRSLGWRSTPVDVAMERTVEDRIRTNRDRQHEPSRDAEERLLDSIAG